MKRSALALLLTGALAACSARADDVPQLGPQTYAVAFTRPATPADFAGAYPGLATWGYFGNEPLYRTRHLPMTQAIRSTSRAWPGTMNLYVDADYCPGATTPSVSDGALNLDAYRFGAADRATCGRGREWASAMVTSQPSFAQAYGYFEIDARLPCDPGRWSAFWLLPRDRTPTNGGRLAEVDVFEHYGGPVTLQSQGRPFVVDRVGRPFSTLHSGVTGAETVASDAQSMPAITPAESASFCAGRHTFGVLWTPAEFRFYVDRRETFRTPNPGVSDPHYWVANLDISRTAGDPAADPDPSRYRIYSVNAWALAPVRP